MIIAFLIYGSRTHPLSWILFLVCYVMLPLLLSSQCVMTNPGTIMSCFAQRVVPILVFNGVDGFLQVILYPSAGNPRHTSTILLGSSHLITFVLFLYLARCTSMIATRGKSSYPSRLQLMPPSPHYDFNTDKVCNSLRIQVLVDTCAMSTWITEGQWTTLC